MGGIGHAYRHLLCLREGGGEVGDVALDDGILGQQGKAAVVGRGLLKAQLLDGELLGVVGIHIPVGILVGSGRHNGLCPVLGERQRSIFARAIV